MTDPIAKLKEYALANYERGMDHYVECYEADDWTRLLAECDGSVTRVKRLMREVASVRRERMADAKIEAEAGR